MPQHANPDFGFMQPDNGAGSFLRFQRMAGRPKKVVTPKDIIGKILLDNIAARMKVAFPKAVTEKAQIEALSSRSGVGKETLRKILKAEQSPKIDTVDKIARAFGSTAAVMLSVDQPAEKASIPSPQGNGDEGSQGNRFRQGAAP
jgi:transcriptional regulator with XRE-family HTH domain